MASDRAQSGALRHPLCEPEREARQCSLIPSRGARFLSFHKSMDTIDQPEIGLPPGSKVRHEAGIIDRSLAESRRGHPAPFKEGVDLGKKGVCAAHGEP